MTQLDIHSKICGGSKRNTSPAPKEAKTIHNLAEELKLKFTENELTELIIKLKN